MITIRNDFTVEQLNKISEISHSFGISAELAKILFARGIDDNAKVGRFLHPGKSNFYNPFLLSGMKEAVARITAARDNGERILVFGDYDADGVCASTVMKKALAEFGVEEVYAVVPERSQGYGLTHDLVEKVLEKYYPDLLITVDCGISCKDEVDFIQDVGVDVIVTDHHEIPEQIPDCTVINCKLRDQEYPCDYLCGAGVAYKVAYALIGERANKYLDLVTLATIADSMVLLDENRDIVTEGLKLIGHGGNRALEKLIEKCGLKEVNSTGLAFTVAPRINAAGRMDDAHCALSLLLETDPLSISEKCEILNEYNLERQNLCDKLLRSAKEKLMHGGLHKKCIVLADKSWNGGLVGIVAAKLVEEYNRPVVLFTGSDGKFHGSVRSIEYVNIFQAVAACKDDLIDFGGHSQAAGITIAENMLPIFEKHFSDFLDENYTAKQFEPEMEVECLVDKPLSMSFVQELELLEPCGVGNRKPVFCVDSENINAYPIKPGSPHVSFKTEFLDFMYFNGERRLDLLNAPAKKRIAFEPNISVFNGRASLKGFVKNIDYSLTDNERLRLDCFKNDLLSYQNGGDVETCDNQLIAEFCSAKNDKNHSYLYVASNPQTLIDYGFELGDCQLYRPDPRLSGSTAILSLKDFSNRDFDAVVYLDRPMFNRAANAFDSEFYVADKYAFDVKKLSVDRAVFAEVFKILKLNRFYGNSSVDVALGVESETLSKEQIIFSLEVFLELGFFSFIGGALQLDKTIKKELGSSALYAKVAAKLG